MLERPVPAERLPSLLDEDYLIGLDKHLGAAHARELLADGVMEIVGRLERLGDLARDGDCATIAALSHEIAGAAGHLGLALLSHYAARASYAAREGADPLPWIEALMETRSASIGALREYCVVQR